MIHRIEIFRGENCWLARITVEVSARELLGTDVFPTPFMPQVAAHVVKARLQELNPGARIIFLEEVPQPL